MIGLDLGTTSCKAILLDAEGRVAAAASESYPLRVPRPGWAEQDVLVIREAVIRTLRAVAAATSVAPTGDLVQRRDAQLLPGRYRRARPWRTR